MLNKAILIGNLGKEPEVKYMADGGMIVNFSLATTESYKNKSGEKVQNTEWHNISVFGKLAEICANYLHKGSKIYLEGKIQTRSWEDKEGVKRYSTGIVMSEMKMLDGKKEHEAPADRPAEDYKPADDGVPF